MAETYVIHWHGKRNTGLHSMIGTEAACVRKIMSEEDLRPDEIVKVECYFCDERWSRDVTEDVARAVAKQAQRDQDAGGDGITERLRDFLEQHAGLSWVRGLRVVDLAFAAA